MTKSHATDVKITNIGTMNINNAIRVVMKLMDLVINAQLVVMIQPTRFIVAIHAPVMSIKHPLLLQLLVLLLQLQLNVLNLSAMV